MIVVADTGPLNYLILSGHDNLLHELYGEVFIPASVHRELSDQRAPLTVRNWIEELPFWAKVRQAVEIGSFAELGAGEREALSLALELRADFVLMDETAGRRIAVKHNIAVKGTLGVLEEAANRKLINLSHAIHSLRETGIFLADEIVADVLRRHRED